MPTYPCWLIVQDGKMEHWRRVRDDRHLTAELTRIAEFPKLKVLGVSDRRGGLVLPLPDT